MGIFLAAVAIGVGILVLLPYVFGGAELEALGALLVQWAMILGAFALLLGAFNLIRVHARRIREGRGALYSAVLLVAMIVVLLLGLWRGPEYLWMRWLFDYVQVPLQAAFFSLSAFFVATAAWRALRVRDGGSLVMVVVAVLVLLAQVPLGERIWPDLVVLKDRLLAVPITAGARGILLGVVLGSVVTGLRVLGGIDRPYRGE